MESNHDGPWRRRSEVWSHEDMNTKIRPPTVHGRGGPGRGLDTWGYGHHEATVADTHRTLLPRGHLAAPCSRPPGSPCMKRAFANLLLIFIVVGMLSQLTLFQFFLQFLGDSTYSWEVRRMHWCFPASGGHTRSCLWHWRRQKWTCGGNQQGGCRAGVRGTRLSDLAVLALLQVQQQLFHVHHEGRDRCAYSIWEHEAVHK